MLVDEMKIIAEAKIKNEEKKELVKIQLIPVVKNMIVEILFDEVKNHMFYQLNKMSKAENNRKIKYDLNIKTVYSYSDDVEDGDVTPRYGGAMIREHYFNNLDILKSFDGDIYDVGLPTIKIIEYKCHQMPWTIFGKCLFTNEGIEIIQSIIEKINDEGISTVLFAKIYKRKTNKYIFKEIDLTKGFKFIQIVNSFSNSPDISICLRCIAVF